MRCKFTNEAVIQLIMKILVESMRDIQTTDGLIYNLRDIGVCLREKAIAELYIFKQSSFEISFRFQSIIDTLIAVWKSDLNTQDLNDIRKAKNYIMDNCIEISRLTNWTETSEIATMDYLISKGVE